MTKSQREFPRSLALPIAGSKAIAARLITVALVLWAALTGIGVTVVRAQKAGYIPWDADVEFWLEDHRTPFLDDLSAVGSGLADTKTCIAITIVLVVSLRLRSGRWYESWMVVLAITGELWLFLGVTFTVLRDRPDVELLDSAPPTSSFPSGHVAASVALYGCMAVLLLRRFHRHPLAILGATLLWLVPVAVAASRLYRGMHFPSDVTMGALGGGLWLLTVALTFRNGHEPVPLPTPSLPPRTTVSPISVPATPVQADPSRAVPMRVDGPEGSDDDFAR